jgi:hypothetical protein
LRGSTAPSVDGAVARDLERQPHRGRQRGLGAAGLAGAQPLDREAEPLAVGVELVELLRLVAVARDDERAAEAQLDAELAAEGREAVERAQPEIEQRLLAELQLGDGREHAGGVAPGAVLAGLEHERPQAALGGPPRDGEADDAPADDGYVVLLGLR